MSLPPTRTKRPIERAGWPARLGSPGALMAMALAATALLAVLPSPWTGRLRDAAAAALGPGQRACGALRGAAGRAAGWTRAHFGAADRLARAEQELAGLRTENARLAAALATLRAQAADAARDAPGDARQRLLALRTIDARVLGRQARAYLGRHELLDVGSAEGVEPAALVVDRPPLLDRGDDAGLEPGQLVLSGCRVWGMVAQLGAHVCAVRTVTEAGYRDLVELAAPADTSGTPSRRPRGVLEGTGQPLARIRLVEVTEPVAVGDVVYAASVAGASPVPLVYGRVVRVEQPVGAAHWEIWMEPALAADGPDEVAVLRLELNPLRVARGG